MGEKLLIDTKRIIILGVIFGLLFSGCAPSSNPLIENVPSILDPQSPDASTVAGLWWIFFGLGTLIYLGVMAYLVFILIRKRQNQEVNLPDNGRRLIIWGGIVMPVVVLLFLFAITLSAMASETTGGADALTIEVTGKQWWWEVHYTEQQFYTANEIHIPAGQPVQFKLRSEDVIHSFWIPQLNGKKDMTPGRVTTLWIQANQPGIYWGECAEYCGTQHAKMQFVVVAHTPDEFAAWVEAQQLPAREPESELEQRGQEVFLGSTCITCHTVRGTHATGELGPDLTHLASRRTLGAGTVENNTGNLGGWVADPHSIKPGNLMPPTDSLNSEDFQALLSYLESLE